MNEENEYLETEGDNYDIIENFQTSKLTYLITTI